MNVALKPTQQPNVLLLSDNSEMRDMWHIVLMHQYPELNIYHAGCNAKGEAFARELSPDVIVVESSWPNFAGLQSIKNIRSALDGQTLLLGMSFDQPHYEEDIEFRDLCHQVFGHPVQISHLHRHIKKYFNQIALPVVS